MDEDVKANLDLDIILHYLLCTPNVVWFPPSAMGAGNKQKLIIAFGRIDAINFLLRMGHICVL